MTTRTGSRPPATSTRPRASCAPRRAPTYDYDALGALTKATVAGKVVSYAIDSGGRRVAEQGDSTTHRRFLYGRGLGPLAELDDDSNVVSRFIYATHSNVPDLMVKGGKTYRIVTDQVGSPRAVVDTATGTVEQELDYDAFGNVTRDTQPGFQPFGFAGGLYDLDTEAGALRRARLRPAHRPLPRPGPAALRRRRDEPLRLRARGPGQPDRPERPDPGHDPRHRVHPLRPLPDR